MKVLLLAAGLGTRLIPLTKQIPKCLVPIRNRPLLSYWLRLLEDSGISPECVLVNLHYFPEKVKNFLSSDSYGRFVKTVYEQELLGTGGTLLANRSYLGEDQVMLVHADNLSVFDCSAFIESHSRRPKNTEITMMTFRTDSPETCGILELDNQNVVIKFHEKVENPPGNIANGAVYILEATIFQYLESLKKTFIDFSTEVIPAYLGKINTYENTIFHRDIGNLKSLQLAEIEFNESQYRQKLRK